LKHVLLQHRGAIERCVGAHLGRGWRVSGLVDLRDRASHPAACLTDGDFEVFAKLAVGRNALVQLRTEAENLHYLTDCAGVLTPRIIIVVPVQDGALMIMEAVAEVPRRTRHWRHYGHTLARLHQVQSEKFGFGRDGYWGDLRISNEWSEDWPAFFWTHRVEPGLKGAVDSGHLPADLARSVDALRGRWQALCGPPVTPSLLHGDAHQNNVLATEKGAVLVDPAPCYGHPEFDLANVDYFEPVSGELFRAYEEIVTISEGFEGRRELWRLPFHLAMVEVEGSRWLSGLETALDTLV